MCFWNIIEDVSMKCMRYFTKKYSHLHNMFAIQYKINYISIVIL